MDGRVGVAFKCISNCLPYAKCSSLVLPLQIQLHKYTHTYVHTYTYACRNPMLDCKIEGVLPYAYAGYLCTCYKSIN